MLGHAGLQAPLTIPPPLLQLGGDVLGAHASKLATALLAELGGRLWEGKASLLAALGGLCETAPAALSAGGGHAAVVDAVLVALARKNAAFR